ncbi:unnamed protein product [Rotaria sp. Silwood1]|nr:unnamed protein product [Rotaria sp. Silwood1]CAF0752529.1 unnamed protein product [Rotaria sp. Silwood1]CAF3330354.1 unnamed protein product [Rotaria sp. Silwood1]CAF3353561.1 unnamed protein product [Rotaria sp. Silwood1]CAF4541034.1 unnamed protein product [Rotaria sp. Silwood1]
MCDIVDPYEPSPHEITRSNWREFRGNKQYCKAYKDFFEQELTASGDNWRKKFLDLLLEDKAEPMINSVVCGLLHPLIHIGYAFELDSSIVAIEALTQTAVCDTLLHKVIDHLKPPKLGSKSVIEVFQDIHSDDRLSIDDTTPIFDKIKLVVENLNDLVLYHYDQWKINENNLEKTIEDMFDFSVYIYGATHKSDKARFDFLFLHLLTGMHAIRVIYPHFDDQKVAEHILLQFFYFACVLYIANARPKINKKLIDDYEVDNSKNNWDYVIDRTLNSSLAEIMHLVKVVHSLRAAEAAYGVKNGLYLKTAVKTVDNLNVDDPWVGASDNPQHLISLKNQ